MYEIFVFLLTGEVERTRVSTEGVFSTRLTARLASGQTVEIQRRIRETRYRKSQFSQGSIGSRVTAPQQRLNELGAGIAVDGAFDIGIFQMNEVHAAGDLTGFRHDMLYYQTNVQKAHALFVSSGYSFQPWYSSESCWG